MLSLPSPARGRRALVAAGCTVAAIALSPAVASADSIVYVKDANVWLANADGSGTYQVTTDGTAEHPYRSPSQADDGTIAVCLRHRDPAHAPERLGAQPARPAGAR